MARTKPSPSAIHNMDLPSRKKAFTPLGTSLFIILRLADILLQFKLVSGWGRTLIESLGGSVTTRYSHRGSTGLSAFYLLITALAAGSSVKQIIWVFFTSEQEMPMFGAVMIAGFNTFLNSLNSLLALWSWTFAATGLPTPALPTCLGLVLYVTGILFEQVSEFQRKAFKADVRNKGCGYTLWRAGHACVAAGAGWGVAVGLLSLYDFTTRAVPALDKYCTERYGMEFLQQKKRVPYRLIPGVY
ncbi:hypothetical protein B0A49_00022 [Cryomyces minteri]|uniref:Steroid 5-alpha reductase C-terminal domain-containing protein n=1 Tax=Cryomyces minteri TaxID=331657 RepID=A0A4U0Y2U4_9PEZI|nr:hypothetical protein B0A49_00022 [Cryomyces minteri]